jgi:hypothetical protein
MKNARKMTSRDKACTPIEDYALAYMLHPNPLFYQRYFLSFLHEDEKRLEQKISFREKQVFFN